MTKYIVPVSSPDGQQGDEFEIEADSVEEAKAKTQKILDDGIIITGDLHVGQPRYA